MRTLIRAHQLHPDISGLVVLYGNGVFMPYTTDSGVVTINSLEGNINFYGIGGLQIIPSGNNLLFSGGASSGGANGGSIFPNGILTGLEFNIGQNNIYNTLPSGFGGIIGGENNTISGDAEYAVIVGGYYNYTSQYNSIVLGGDFNSITGVGGNAGNSAIVGGDTNTVSSFAGFIGGGYSNTISPDYCSYSSILGGEYNLIFGDSFGTLSYDSAIIGGYQNSLISASQSVMAGGHSNYLSGSRYSFVGAGQNARMHDSDYAGIIGGFNALTKSASYSFLGGGQHNSISGGTYSVVLGGLRNALTGANYSAIVGGDRNVIKFTNGGSYQNILGGFRNVSDGNGTCLLNAIRSSVSGNFITVINGTYVSGQRHGSTVFGSAANNASFQGYQKELLHWVGQTTDATITELNLGGSFYPTSFAFIEPNSIWNGTVEYIGLKTDGSSKTYGRKYFAIENIANTVTLLETSDLNGGSGAYSLFLSGNNDGKRLSVLVSGQTSHTVKWKVSAFFDQIKV